MKCICRTSLHHMRGFHCDILPYCIRLTVTVFTIGLRYNGVYNERHVSSITIRRNCVSAVRIVYCVRLPSFVKSQCHSSSTSTWKTASFKVLAAVSSQTVVRFSFSSSDCGCGMNDSWRNWTRRQYYDLNCSINFNKCNTIELRAPHVSHKSV